MKDNEYVNFSEDYELNHHLRKLDKRQTQDNRDILKKIGDDTKKANNSPRLKHSEFEASIKKNKTKLD